MIPLGFLKPVDRLFEGLAPPLRTLLAVAGIALVALLDIATGAEVSFSIFYLAPILAIAWYGGRRSALLCATLSALAWLAADQYVGTGYSQAWIGPWNAGVRFGFFLICVSLLGRVRSLLEQQRAMAETDGLTGLKNSRAFHAALRQEVERGRRYQQPLTLAYLDLDNFKQVNDRWGHEAGDAVLRTAAEIFGRHLRATDVVARLGGDEFALLLPQVTAAEACQAIDKARGLLLAAMQQGGWPVTCSVGAVTFLRLDLDPKEMVQVADELMYEVKRSGKNAVQHACHTGCSGGPKNLAIAGKIG